MTAGGWSPDIESLLRAIVDADGRRVRSLLRSDPRLATSRISRARLYEGTIVHWIYVGDTPLHLAAAGHRAAIAQLLLEAGAGPNATDNHRRSSPLHYAADGYIAGPSWNPEQQVATIRHLLAAGADLDARDKNGATSLHRAVRTRCSAAVSCLLAAGADPTIGNLSGSTPFHLAVQSTGRGGTANAAARDAQREIIDTLVSKGVSVLLRDGKGKTVLERVESDWIRDRLGDL